MLQLLHLYQNCFNEVLNLIKKKNCIFIAEHEFQYICNGKIPWKTINQENYLAEQTNLVSNFVKIKIHLLCSIVCWFPIVPVNSFYCWCFPFLNWEKQSSYFLQFKSLNTSWTKVLRICEVHLGYYFIM